LDNGTNGHSALESGYPFAGEAAPTAVGVFDSGLGGLTVAREIMRRMPGTPMIYLADTAHVPYGPRPAEEIREFAHGIVRALMDAGAGAIVAACNMSSALAIPYIRDDYPVPMIGMIGPGVDAALRVAGAGPLGVLATEGTCNSGAYPRRAREFRPDMDVIQVGCPEFVPLVESGAANSPAALAASERYLRPLLDAGCETVILGCTHYPWLLPALKAVAGPGVTFVDPAEAVGEELRRLVGDAVPGERPCHRFAATALPERLEEGARNWLGVEAEAEYWPLWEPAEVNPAGAAALAV
jgi:glutamate racemase